jgi:hypothetical protein
VHHLKMFSICDVNIEARYEDFGRQRVMLVTSGKRTVY